MLRFLSDEWIAALDDAARRSAALSGVLAGEGEEAVSVVVQHVVTDVPISTAPSGEVAYRVVLDDGPTRVVAGRADDPTVTFTQSYDTARAVASGATSAQVAFMAGDLRLGGRVDQLLTHHAALSGIDDVFADVRARTDW